MKKQTGEFAAIGQIFWRFGIKHLKTEHQENVGRYNWNPVFVRWLLTLFILRAHLQGGAGVPRFSIE